MTIQQGLDCVIGHMVFAFSCISMLMLLLYLHVNASQQEKIKTNWFLDCRLLKMAATKFEFFGNKMMSLEKGKFQLKLAKVACYFSFFCVRFTFVASFFFARLFLGWEQRLPQVLAGCQAASLRRQDFRKLLLLAKKQSHTSHHQNLVGGFLAICHFHAEPG